MTEMLMGAGGSPGEQILAMFSCFIFGIFFLFF